MFICLLLKKKIIQIKVVYSKISNKDSMLYANKLYKKSVT